MSNRMSKAIRSIACVVALILFFLWSCAPVVIVVASASKVEAVDSQKEEFTTSTNESTTPAVESESSIGPEVKPEDQGEGFMDSEEIVESVAEETKTSETKETEAVHSIVLTDKEKEILATIIYLEGGGESYECQLAIGSVIINRLQDGYWGNTLEQVLYAKNQFTPAYKINSTTPTDQQRKVVEQLLIEGPTLPSYVMYFRARYYFSWATPYKYIDDTYFSYLEKDK